MPAKGVDAVGDLPEQEGPPPGPSAGAVDGAVDGAGYDVVVVGGGVIGLSVGWWAARTGRSVAVCDPAPGQGSSWAAAGMLAPLSEASPVEAHLYPLAADSLRRWPAFAAALAEDGGGDVGLRTDGTLVVAAGDDDRRALAELRDRMAAFDPPGRWLGGGACRRLEPALHPGVRGGFEVPGDLQVDNRAVLAALQSALATRQGELIRSAVVAVELAGAGAGAGGGGGRLAGGRHRVHLEGGATVEAGWLVLATGAGGHPIGGVPAACQPPVRPVRGDIVRLQGHPDEPVLERVVRAQVDGRHVYLVPRRNGQVVVGATSEEGGYRTTSRAGAVHDLLHDALTVVPELAELELAEVCARLRPATPDNAPVLGPTAADKVAVAAGHYRNGFLLAPVTAAAVVATVCNEEMPAAAAACGAGRFG